MALIVFLLLIAWTLLVVRLLSIGATVSERTFVTYLALGSVMALTVSPLAEKIIVPYNLWDYNLGYLAVFLPMIVRNLALLAPVVAYLLLRRNFLRLSIADAFLLAFAVGFGYEVVAPLLASSLASKVPAGITLLPPWQITWDDQQRIPIVGLSGHFAIAGVGYTTGFAALVLAAMLRFSGKLAAGLLTCLSLLLILTAHEAMWTTQFATVGVRGPTSGMSWAFDLLLWHGKLFAPAALATLVYFTIREIAWTYAASANARSASTLVIEEYRTLFSMLLRDGFRACLRASAEARLRRRIELTKAEYRRAPADRELFQTVRLLEIQSTAAAAHLPTDGCALLDRRVMQAAWSALLLVVVLMPWLPAWLVGYLWKFPLLHLALPLLPLTLIQAALVFAVLRWFLQGPAQLNAHWDADATCRFHGQNVIAHVAMGKAILVLFQVPLNFYPPSSPLTNMTRAPMPTFDAGQITVLILLVALITCGLGVRGAAAWRREASQEQQFSAAIRKWIILVNAAVITWISLRVYLPTLIELQKDFGPISYTIFGRFGNVAIAILAILVSFAVSLVVGYGLRLVSRRVERFLLRDKQGETAISELGGSR